MANSYKHRSGDRKDGRLLRSLPAISKFIPYFLRDRGSSGILYEEDLDVTAADKCLRQERVNGYKNIGFLHFFIAAYIRCISMLPGLNRFIVGRRVFARDEIDIVLTVKRSETLESSDTRVKIRFEATDTIFDVYRKINTKIDELRTEEVSGTFEDLMESFSRAPRLFIRLGVLVLRIMDYFGWLPQSWLDRSPLHASMLIQDAGMLKTAPAYIQMGNVGTLPVALSVGARHHVYEMDKTGLVTDTKHIVCKAVIDSRIADARYYSQFLNAMRYIFQHPEILERSPTRVVEDVG
ncbi:MAG: hypothetical protein J6M64_00615 [Oscillospiraceae bacterium]|nr:hypothetical protein [Oscillospiraceae bacterium]